MLRPTRPSTVHACRWAALFFGLVLPFACGGGEEPTASTSESSPARSEASGSRSTSDPSLVASDATAEELVDTPLVVNGETVPTAEIRRTIAMGPRGATIVESQKTRVLIDEEIARRIEEGAPAERFEVSGEQIQKTIDEAQEQLRREYPGGEYTDIRALYPMSEEAWRAQIETTLLFDKVYLPENPAEYPETTRQAMEAGAGGPQLLQQLQQSFDQRKEKADAGEEIAEDPAGKAFMTMVQRQLVMKHLNESADIQWPEDGLPVDVICRVNGKDITVDEVWKAIEHNIDPQDVQSARIWFAKRAAVRQALQEGGHWLDDGEFREAYHAHSDPYKESFLSIEILATQYKGFPSVQTYKDYFRISESFKRMVVDRFRQKALAEHAAEIDAEVERRTGEAPSDGSEPLSAEALREEVVQAKAQALYDAALDKHNEERTDDLFGLARVESEMLLASAYDFSKGRWKPEGWAQAEEHAKLAAKELSEGRPWSEVLSEHSEFFDPPTPVSAQGQEQPQGRKNKGRFGAKNRNELLQIVGDNDYSMFLLGSSIVDHVFFEQEVGTIDGPFKGPHGYYITKVVNRLPPTNSRPMSRSGYKDLVEQDYIATYLIQFAEEELARAEVRGL
jgi:hypothetical protein